MADRACASGSYRLDCLVGLPFETRLIILLGILSIVCYKYTCEKQQAFYYCDLFGNPGSGEPGVDLERGEFTCLL